MRVEDDERTKITETLFNGKVLVKDADAFRTVFGASLSDHVEKIGDNYHFNLKKFDELIKTPKNVSTKDHVISKYGADACRLMFRIMLGRN